MRAVVARRDELMPTVTEVGRPEPDPGEALVRTLRVGIDGTDYEVLEGNHGSFPPDTAYRVMGHEAVGVVADPNDTSLEEGRLVVPTVRRPPPDGPNEYFERGIPDMAPPDACLERGIDGAHGYMSEYFTTPESFLVPMPDGFGEFGFLVEPLSNAVKALELAIASRSASRWNPETATVLGNGSLGLLSLLLVDQRAVNRTYCLGRRDRPDPTIDVIEGLDATYVDSRTTPVADLPTAHEPMDIVVEATGHARHFTATIEALAPGGVGAMLGLPTDSTFEVDGGALHRDFVLRNKALVGSVNSNVPHFETAIDVLESAPEWFLEAIVTDVFEPASVADAFSPDDERIKAVVEFDSVAGGPN